MTKLKWILGGVLLLIGLASFAPAANWAIQNELDYKFNPFLDDDVLCNATQETVVVAVAYPVDPTKQVDPQATERLPPLKPDQCVELPEAKGWIYINGPGPELQIINAEGKALGKKFPAIHCVAAAQYPELDGQEPEHCEEGIPVPFRFSDHYHGRLNILVAPGH